MNRSHVRAISHVLCAVAFTFCASRDAAAQMTAALEGRVVDVTGGALQHATVSVRGQAPPFTASVDTDTDGWYHLAAIPPGTYRVTVGAQGFRSEVIDQLIVDIGRTVLRDFRLSIAAQADRIQVVAEIPLLDRATSVVSNVVTAKTVQQTPLNGRHFIDLAQLVPASMAPSQTGFSSRPLRGVGSLAFNISGNREEAVGFLVNGVLTNNLTFGSLIFEPPLGSIEQFAVDSSTLPVEYGSVSGAIATIVTRSGTETFHGDVFELFRNDALDARNFFEFTTPRPHPFNRNQFGGSAGGPIWRERTYFHAVYEGFRQRQGVDLNSLVPSDAQRAAVTDPVVKQLLPLIPRANYFDSSGTPRFVGSAPAVVDIDRWSLDLRHTVSATDRLQLYYGGQQVDGNEPTSQGNSVPGFGHISHPYASILTLGETHTVGSSSVNDIRFGRSHLDGGTFPATALNPATFGIGDGVTTPIGLPQMIVAGDLNFGGPGTLPQGRHDSLYVLNDTFSHSSGRHSLTFGGEYRVFLNQNFAQGTGVFNFPSMAAFLAGIANGFSTTLGLRTSDIHEGAGSAFVQDSMAIHDAVTLDLGLRYEWFGTPTERDGKFVVFDADTASLERVGAGERIYRQNALNFEPRVGIAWAVGTARRTVLRAAYGTAADQPATTAVRDTAGNPPFAAPVTASGVVSISNALNAAQPVGLAPATVDPEFHNGLLQSWNVNVQRQLAWDAAVTVGYMGSRGSHLRISRNINQPINGVRPFAALSSASAILPGAPLGNITQVQSSGYSNYDGAWVALTKRLSHGLELDASYALSKSLDTNSLNSSGFAVQDSYNIAGQYGPSDFDTRHRVIASAIYQLRGWQFAAVVQAQSGNPVNIVTSNSSLNGLPNTVRPDLLGPIRIIGSVDQWFDTSSFVATNHFGDLGRNAVTGPGFSNTDVSIARNLPIGRANAQLRLDVFDVFNHPNFGSPGNIVGSPTFGRITSTRLPTGEAGSSRQIQLAMKVAI